MRKKESVRKASVLLCDPFWSLVFTTLRHQKTVVDPVLTAESEDSLVWSEDGSRVCESGSGPYFLS